MITHYDDGVRRHDEAYAGIVYACACGERFADRAELAWHISEEERVQIETRSDTLFGFAVRTPLKLRARAMQVHGKVCCVETRGPKRSLYLSVYAEREGVRYIIRRGVYGGMRNEFIVLEHLVRA